MRNNQKLDKITEEAIVDAYDEQEKLDGWGALLEDRIKVPQACTVRNNRGKLIKVVAGACIRARVRFDKLTIDVPIEDIHVGDKGQQAYIDAYKEWIYMR